MKKSNEPDIVKEYAFPNKENKKRQSVLIDPSVFSIDEQKEAEEYIGHMSAIVESCEDAIISKSLNGTIRSWNKSSERMFGYTSGQAIGKHISLIIPPEYIDDEKKLAERIRNNEIIDSYETVRNKKNGEQIHVSLTLSPLKDRAGNIIGISKIARDITSLKKSEWALTVANAELAFQNEEKEKRASELIIANKELVFQNTEKEKKAAELIIANKELLFQNDEKGKRAAESAETLERVSFLASIADNIQDPILSADNNFKTTRWNKAAEKLFEWTSEEVIGKITRDVLIVDYLGSSRDSIIESLNEGKSWHGEVIYNTKSGKLINGLTTCSVLKDAEGNRVGTLTLIRDITNRKTAEVALETANKELAFQNKEKEKRVCSLNCVS